MPKRQYSEQEAKFLEALADDSNKGNIRKCMDAAGFSKTSRASNLTRDLYDEIIQIAKDKLALNSVRATYELEGLMDSPDKLGARNALKVATEILDRVGIVKKEEIVVEDKRSSIILLPPKDTD